MISMSWMDQHVPTMWEHVITVSALAPNNNVLSFGDQVSEVVGRQVILQRNRSDEFSGAKVAHESCYTNFNPTGSMTGHCGYDSRLHKYIPCFDP